MKTNTCKNRFFVSFSLVIFFFITSCQQDDTVTIGLLMDEYQQERWSKDRDYLEEKVKEKGGVFLHRDAQGDADKQFEQAKGLIKEGADVLIVVAVKRAEAADIVDYAHKKNVKVIAYDRLITNCDLDFYISFDNVKVGQLQAEYLLEKCPKGSYAMMNGPLTDNNSYLLKIGQLSKLQPRTEMGDVAVIYDEFLNSYSKKEGYEHMEACVNLIGDSIDAVLAGNDQIARGAIAYYLENKDSLLGGKKVYFAGQDAELKSCQSIMNGVQTVTVFKPIRSIANTAATVSFMLARNQEIEADSITSINNNQRMVPTILLVPEIVHRDNIMETVVEGGYHSKEEIMKGVDKESASGSGEK